MSVPSELTRWAYTDPPRAIYELYQLITGGGEYLPLAGGTLTGGLSLNYNSPTFSLNKTAAAQINGIYSYLSGATRWGILPGDSAPESGGNAGSNFDIARFSDSGTFIDMPLTISRSNGIVAFANSPTAPTPGTADNSTNIATTAYVQAQGYATAATVAANYLPLAGGTLTGDLTISEAQANLKIKSSASGGIGLAAIQMTPGAGSDCEIDTYNSAGVLRWSMLLNDGTAETGGNAGSNFRLWSFNDSGANISPVALQITRATSLASFGGSINIPTGSFYQQNLKNLAYIVPNASGDNIFLGESGNATTTGYSNTSNGINALAALTSGYNNNAVGRSALIALTTGVANNAVGYLAITSETSGSNNSAFGQQALFTQNGASNNIGVGAIAGYDLTTGSNNVCVGVSAGRGITTGSGNTVVGYNLTGLPAALTSTMVLGAAGTIMSVASGSNAFYGSGSGNLTMTGSGNAGCGYQSAHALTTGGNNTAIGSSALAAETTGVSNTAVGRNCLSVQNGASSNCAIGSPAGSQITTGGNNIFIGNNAGTNITTGSGNVIIGNAVGLSASQLNCAVLSVGSANRYDWNFTTANTHTFTGGTVATNATPTAGATPVFQSAGALSQASATTNTPALPATRTNGWLMIGFCRVTGATGTTLTCPTSGWTQIVNNLGTGNQRFMAAWAYVTGSEVAPVFTLGTSDTSDAQVVMYSGTAAANPIGASGVASGGAVTSLNFGGITTTRYNSKVIAAALCNGLTTSITPQAAFTQQVTNTDGAWFDAASTTAGTVQGGIFTVASAVTNWGGFLVELLIPPMTPTAVRHNGNVLGTTRWSIELTDGTQEAGSNAGSNFGIQRFSDAGATIDTPISINRATGQTTITNLNPATLLRSYLAGLTLSTAGSSATFSVAAGIAVDSTNANIMSRTASISKTTGAWAVGNAQGSLDTGTIAASTWYHVHLIMRTDTGVVDVLTSLSATAPTLPTNYTLFRRIGSMLTDGGSHWTKFLQTGDIFEWDAGFSEISGGSLATGSAVTVTLGGVPTGVKVLADISGYSTSTTAAATIAAWDADITGHATNSFLYIIPSANGEGSFCCDIMVNTSAQFKWQTSANLTSVNLFTAGWVDRRGRDA